MKLLIIGFAKIKYMPYLNLYLDQIKNRQIEVSVLFWDRDDSTDTPLPRGVISIPFHFLMDDEISKHKKILPFLCFRRFAKKVMLSKQFDRVIILHSLPGVLLASILMRKYSGRYILDYRDVSYEKFPPYKMVLSFLIKKSYLTFVSSDAFRKVLPIDDKIHTFHNLDLTEIENSRSISQNRTDCTKRKPIKIAFWGLIRYYESNASLMKLFCNDPRFELHYYGREQKIANELKVLSQTLDAKNIVFHGPYINAERFDFCIHADIINNIYDPWDDAVPYAISNKYYDGLLLKKPQLCTLTTYQAQLVTEKGIGMGCSTDDPELPNKIYDYYMGIDWEDFECNCRNELDRVAKEQEESNSLLDSFLKRLN